MTVTDSSSSASSPELTLEALGLLPELPRTFLEGRDLDLLAPMEFVAWPALPRLRPNPPVRAALAAGLAEANASYGHPRAAELADLLADPETEVVATGQQPGLFGGPLYALSKAVAAARWADELTASGRPAVAIFWMATEDHDFRESSWALFQTPAGPRRFDLGDDPQPLMPVGMRSLGPGVEAVLTELAASMPGDRFAAWCRTLGGWYRPDARFGEAFARLFAHLLGDRCPLLLDAMLPAVKQAQVPWLRHFVERRVEVDRALTEASDRVVERSLPLQVRPQPGSSPLFFLQGSERRRIVWDGESSWSLRGDEAGDRDLATLEAAIADNPGVVMPGVLARPVIQDAILGTSLQVMGPGEISYLPQLAALYDILGVPAPATSLRPQVVMLPAAQRRKLEGIDLTLAELLMSGFELDGALAGDQGEALLAPAREHLRALGDELEQAAAVAAQELAKPLQKTTDQLGRAIDLFESRLTAALGRADEVRRGRVEGLSQWLRPDGLLQERALSVADLPGRYGLAVVNTLYEQMSLDPRLLQVIEC